MWCEPVKLDRIKAIGKAMSGTVNDVMLAAVSGALRRYLVEAGERVYPRLSIRAMVPVSIRRPHEMDQLNNRFGLVLLSLPVGIEDPLERLLVLKRRMDAIKGTPEAAVAFGILGRHGHDADPDRKADPGFLCRQVDRGHDQCAAAPARCSTMPAPPCAR